MKPKQLLTFTRMRAAWKASRLLDLEVAPGRLLRTCTAIECHALGGWPRTLSRRVSAGWGKGRPDRSGRHTVGETYSEAELRLSFGAFYRNELEWAAFRAETPQPGDEFKFR